MVEVSSSKYDRILENFASCISSDPSNIQTSKVETDRLYSIISGSVTPEQIFCSIPSFSLEKCKHHSGIATKASLEHDAASSMAELIEYSRIEVQSLSSVLACNILLSFMSLSDSRVRSTVQAFSRHSENDPTNKLGQTLQMLSAMSCHLVKPFDIENTFRVISNSSQVSKIKRIASLTMETTIHLNILGEHISAVLSCNGTISGFFEISTPKLTTVSVLLDTACFLRTMMSTARDVVKNATNKASQMFLVYSAGVDIIHHHLSSNHNQSKKFDENSHQLQFQTSMKDAKPKLMNCAPSARIDHRVQPRQKSSKTQHEEKQQNESSNNSQPSGVSIGFRGMDLLTLAASSLAHGNETEM